MIDFLCMNLEHNENWSSELKAEINEMASNHRFFYDHLNSYLTSSEDRSVEDIQNFIKTYEG